MDCPKCKTKMAESNIKFLDLYNIFYQRFFCFDCLTFYVCNSQSGDMVQVYLEEVEL